MKKFTIIALLVVIVIFGWMTFRGSEIDYVASVDEEVLALEGELAEIQTGIDAGTLSPEVAGEAQKRVAARINTIQERVADGQNADLSSEDKSRLTGSLSRLMQSLVTYRNTLTAVDQAVLELPEAQRPQLNRGSSNSRDNDTGLAGTVGSLIETVGDFADEVSADLMLEESQGEDGEDPTESTDSSEDTMTEEESTDDGDVTESDTVDSDEGASGEVSAEDSTNTTNTTNENFGFSSEGEIAPEEESTN